jgi:hypothetical protein
METYKEIIYFYNGKDSIEETVEKFMNKNVIEPGNHAIKELRESICEYSQAFKIINTHCVGKVIRHSYTKDFDDSILYVDSYLLVVFNEKYHQFNELD